MKNKIILLITGIGALGGCAATQEVTRITADRPESVCIVRHDAVKEGVLIALEEEFENNGIAPTVVEGIYEQQNSQWHPSWYDDQVQSCDALSFYVANWSWDLATYMSFANIWMTDIAGSGKLAQATYDATRVPGPSKFIDAEAKIKELVGEMLSAPPPPTAP